MDGGTSSPGLSRDDTLDPPARLFERLRQISGYYSWDETQKPLHTSYNNWHIYGTRFVSSYATASASSSPLYSHHVSSPSSLGRVMSGRPSPGELPGRSSPVPNSSTGNAAANISPAHSPGSQTALDAEDQPLVEETVVARVSFHVLREERAFHIVKNINTSSDPRGEHVAKPIDLLRLTPHPSDRGPLTVAIYQSPGPSLLPDLLNLGPAFYYAQRVGDAWEASIKHDFHLEPPISLELFFEFAIGATECLELIHHSQNIVHGEIRGDAFHFNRDTHKVKLVSFGSGLRSFEDGLMSTGWSALSKELGARNKLLYISPEQTGRMPAEPDSRTDIYSLGILFWTLLTQKPVFDGELPLDIVQGVLGRQIPNVSSIRLDVPDAVGRIIQKCTAKNTAERYHSASGLRYDLTRVNAFLANGDLAALKDWQVASRDVSSLFMLPTTMIGRDEPRQQLLDVIARVARTHFNNSKNGSQPFADVSSFSNDFADPADASSEGTGSSIDGINHRSGSFSQTISPDLKTSRASLRSHQSPLQATDTQSTTTVDTVSSAPSKVPLLRLSQKAWERHQSVSSHDLKSPLDSTVAERDGSSSRYAGSMSVETSSLSRQLGSAKFRRRGQCEIIAIEGTGGLGKSHLIQSVLGDVRRLGYCATTKFDQTGRPAFGPLLGLLSSLFRQVWGERNTDTPFHLALKQYVSPVWPMLHPILDLPEFLFTSPEKGPSASRAPPSSAQGAAAGATRNRNASHASDLERRGSSSSPGATSVSLSTGLAKCGSSSANASNAATGGMGSRVSAASSQEFLRAGAATKSNRLMNTVNDVLRMFTRHKFICFCLEDLHFADTESLDLLAQIINARLEMIIIVTYRPEELSPERLEDLLSPAESEDNPKTVGPTITKVKLDPLSEADIVKYVSMTLKRPEPEVSAFAMVLQAKTAGSPFYMREMLNACYRKKCIWYDYSDNLWLYDINRVFEQFRGDSDYDTLNTDFVTGRLRELPPASRAILAWAALIGNDFSFDLILHLLSGEFNFIDETCTEPLNEHVHTAYSQQDAVAGLQAALQACIIISSETDDRFHFAHDRYIVASSGLKVCNTRKMHYVITRTLLKYYGDDPRTKNNAASHICESIDVIKKKVHQRQSYRNVLFECGRAATENGARPTAAKYYSNAVALLQPDPWIDDGSDSSYDETLQLYLRAAESYLYMGQHPLANSVLSTIFRSARSALDKAPAWVLQSRAYNQCGNASRALVCLKECLSDMGVSIEENPTCEQCDRDFERLAARIQSMDRSDVKTPPGSDDPVLASIGAVLAEASSISWWSDGLFFYHLSLVMVDLHLTSGAFPQSGMGFVHLAMVAISRFNMIQLGSELGSYSLELLDHFRDPFSMARGYMMHASFVGHIQYPLGLLVTQLEGSIEFSASSGDRISAVLSFGLTAMMKFFAGESYSDLEAFCQFCCEEIPNWHQDTQGGTLLIAVRQVSRALQGKTTQSDAVSPMSDDQHNSESYKQWLQGATANAERSLLFYETLEIVPLYLYGHYEKAIELGERCLDRGSLILSARNARLVLLFYGLARAGVILRRQHDPRIQAGVEGHTPEERDEVEATIAKLQELSQSILDWAKVSDTNYLAWATLLDAQVSELQGKAGNAIRQYEEALDHASEHNFLFEEALGNYLMAGIFIRKRARRSARSALRDAIGLYRQLGAFGVATRIEEDHSLLLRGPTRNLRTLDTGVQTDYVADTTPVQYRGSGNDAEQAGRDTRPIGGSTAGISTLHDERIGVGRDAMPAEVSGVDGLPTLDMIDLHAILQSAQVISSVLRVDELLKTMCDVILQTCGGSATQAAIVVLDEDGSDWCVAASGDPEKGAVAHIPGIPLKGTSIVAENVVLYSMRFRESAFVSDLVSDERFGNVSESWLQKNPHSKSVICIPIRHASNPLLGVLYLEGLPGAFTDRNKTVLKLLVDQIGISYSNALSIKAIEKVSAENRSMVAIQKAALRKAIEAENKAKAAEKEARRNVKLAEEAEAEAKRNVKLAEEAVKAKSVFLANVSHELRTPLNGVIGNSELLRGSNLTAEQQEMAEAIRISADLLLIVINDILDFSRMEADKMKLYITVFAPRELIPEMVRATSFRNPAKTEGVVQIVKQVYLPKDLYVFGDPVRLHQVLGNLIGNSIKFTERGTVTIGGRVEAETEGTVTLQFWVEDTGIGIAAEKMGKLFQPFSQADASTARKYGGSGLGLSICKSLIETIMGGKITLTSTENVGTKVSFSVTFDKAQKNATPRDMPATVPASSPYGDVSTTPSPTSASFAFNNRTPASQSTSTQNQASTGESGPTKDPKSTTAPPLSSLSSSSSSRPLVDLAAADPKQLRVCIAEDNPINRKIVIQYMQRLGYTMVDAYDNGQKTVEALRKKAEEGTPYHVVLMDVQMPILDGYEATKLLRRDPIQAVREVLVIAVTASAIQGDREKCLAAGMNDYLAKPLRPDVLRRKLEFYLENKHGASTGGNTGALAAKVEESGKGTDQDNQFMLLSPPPPPGQRSSASPSSEQEPLPRKEEALAGTVTEPQTAVAAAPKRQQKKLVKRRTHSDVALAPGSGPVGDRPSSSAKPAPPGILQKRTPLQRWISNSSDGADSVSGGGSSGGPDSGGTKTTTALGTANSTTGNVHAPAVPLGALKPEDGRRSLSFASITTSRSKESKGGGGGSGDTR